MRATTNRRNFILSAASASIIPFVKNFGNPAADRSPAYLSHISMGVISQADNPEADLKIVRDLGFSSCQLNVSHYNQQLAEGLHATLKKYKLSPVSLICMGPGEYAWNLKDGPSTIGLIPRQTRTARIERLKTGIDFCQAAGIPAVHAHFGFIPEDPRDTLYVEFLLIMKGIAEYARSKNIDIYFETGQETPITLLRVIEDIGTNNLFVNYDLANFILYGKADPVSGLKTLGKYIKSIHAKDGLYPTDPYGLGHEVLIPQGEVNFPAVIAALKKMNFAGNITIECELSGTNKDYILKTKKYLEALIRNN
jgi:L-ribulose-5-phosphate 3-epimerase